MLEYTLTSGIKKGREALASSERGCQREQQASGVSTARWKECCKPGWEEEHSSFFIERSECSQPSRLPRPLAGSKNQLNSLQSNVLFILQVTINSKIKLRADVCEQAPESLKLPAAAHLGSSPTRDEGGPLGSCRPGPNPTSSRIWSWEV